MKTSTANQKVVELLNLPTEGYELSPTPPVSPVSMPFTQVMYQVEVQVSASPNSNYKIQLVTASYATARKELARLKKYRADRKARVKKQTYMRKFVLAKEEILT